MRRFLVLLVLIAVIVGAAAAWWLQAPLTLAANQSLELEIEPGTTPRAVARAVVQAGVQTDARLLYWWFRLSGKDRGIKAGNYEIPQGTSPYELLQKLVRGEEALRAVTLVDVEQLAGAMIEKLAELFDAKPAAPSRRRRAA